MSIWLSRIPVLVTYLIQSRLFTFCWGDPWVPGTGTEEARTWRRKNWWGSWCVWGWSLAGSGGEGRKSRSDGDGPGPGEQGPLLCGWDQGGGTEGCDGAEPHAWTLLPLGESSSVNWQEEGSEAGNRQGLDSAIGVILSLSWLGTQSEVSFDPGYKIMQRRFPYYSTIDWQIVLSLKHFFHLL